MSKNNIISVSCFDEEIGKIGYDENEKKSFFQYHPDFLKSGQYKNLFPFIFKNVNGTQVFSQYNNDSFRGLPPMIADSLPDFFGNIVFKTWLENQHKNFTGISPLEQLAYVANRGMGALEYTPSAPIPKRASVDLDEIVHVLKIVLEQKQNTNGKKLDTASLFNIFKLGSSAGGVGPKILISKNKKTGHILPGDVLYSNDYYHYLVKLYMEDTKGYNKEIIEYAYYQTATELGITMMPSELIDNQHFATQRFDRQNGEKQHILTATGMTGWDFKDYAVSNYGNLFKLATYLKLSGKEIDELFLRMVFNVVFCNTDDHLKNHAFIYNKEKERWHLSPAYDLTYSLNPLLNYTRASRALSINNKRIDITLQDVLSIAEAYTIKNPKGIIEAVQAAIPLWKKKALKLNIKESIVLKIEKDFKRLLF
jgi:serine/threonine-protein kinase HipA